MELLKKNIHMMREKGRTVNRITLEEDCNVPDSQADAERIIQNKAEVKMEIQDVICRHKYDDISSLQCVDV